MRICDNALEINGLRHPTPLPIDIFRRARQREHPQSNFGGKIQGRRLEKGPEWATLGVADPPEGGKSALTGLLAAENWPRGPITTGTRAIWLHPG